MDKLEAAEVTSTAQEPSAEPGDEALTEPDSHAAVPEAQEDKGKWHLLREIVETIALTVIIFAAINLVTGRFRIEGPSMLPNLHQGQYLIINKVVYKLHPPRRGDIIVFHHPRNPNRDLIKRVVGLPGEAVEIRNGQVYVGGTLLDEPYVRYQGRNSGHYELGPDEYFVLGDNRPNSEDSRNWGVLTGNQIVGKAWISYWPPGDLGAVRHFGYPDSRAAEKQSYGQEIGLLETNDWLVHWPLNKCWQRNPKSEIASIMDKEISEAIEFCESCHIGKLQRHKTTYSHWHEGALIVVPGVPAWRCDYCGSAFYDDETLTRLILLLGPDAISHDRRRGRAKGVEGGAGEGLSDRRCV